jgi:CheY-like chemotaxis protein
MTYLLRAFGRTVLHADNGLYGVALAGDRKPDLIDCDVQLPGLDGYGVTRRLADEPDLSGIPLIAVTAFSVDRETIAGACVDDCISKPIVPESFVEQLNRLLPPTVRAGPLSPRGRLPCP